MKSATFSISRVRRSNPGFRRDRGFPQAGYREPRPLLVMRMLCQHRIPCETFGRDWPVFPQDGQGGNEVPGVGVALQWFPAERGALG
jgi:hypothetical protein